MADDEGYVETLVENKRLRERIAELEIDLAKWVQFWRDKDNAALKVRIEELESAMREIYEVYACLLYTSPSPRDYAASRMPSSA